jgi:hypothetical protein
MTERLANVDSISGQLGFVVMIQILLDHPDANIAKVSRECAGTSAQSCQI